MNTPTPAITLASDAPSFHLVGQADFHMSAVYDLVIGTDLYVRESQPLASDATPQEELKPTKEQALRDLAFIEDIWQLAPDLPYTRRLRQFIEAAGDANG